MPERGIPPSLDRLDARRSFLLSILLVVLAVAGVLTLAMFLRGREREATDLESANYQQNTMSPYLEEIERASAYAALRAHVDERDWGPGVEQAYCRDSWHQIRGTYFEFHGRIDLLRKDGTLQPLDYAATLSGSSRQGWEIIAFGTEEAEGEGSAT